MNRLDLRDGAYAAVYERLDFLPSTREKAFDSFIKYTNICTVKDLCLTKRERLLVLPNVGKAFVDSIEDYLKLHGLRFGMTMDELYDYMDESYLEDVEVKAVKAEEAATAVPDSKNGNSSIDSEKERTEIEPVTKSEDGRKSMDFELAVILCSFLGAFSAITFELILDNVIEILLRFF